MTRSKHSTDYPALRTSSAAALRQTIREGAYTGHTAGLAAGKLQVNLAILPAPHAEDFTRFCQGNPKPCPLVGVSDPGAPGLPSLGADIDIRTDLSGYNVYRHGVLVEARRDILDLWSADLVAFALGCSFTFERALMEAGISLWHIENDKTVPMYRSNLETRPAGPFGGAMVVSMRALKPEDVDAAVRISSRFPQAHGAPLHMGSPSVLGIADLDRPDWGDPQPLGDGQVPVFWACGVTPQNAIMRARLPFCITHKPGHMLITDVEDSAGLPVF